MSSKKRLAQRRPIACIVPPHMLREIARRGDPDQRLRALGTLALSERLRGRREAIGAAGAPLPPGERRRTVFDAAGGYELPGSPVRREGDPPTGDPAVDEAFEGAGATWALFREVYERDSIDGRGMRLDASVHYGSEYGNAFWDGRQMVYGDGDGRLFLRFTRALDVIGHELTHGVIQFEADLSYRGQPGALNESFADVFGSLVKQRARNQEARDADWLIGEGLLGPEVRGKGIRSMGAPGTAYDDPVIGKDPQPARMSDYQDVDFDEGGVHINSGIPNHAFYRAAMAIGGPAWSKAGWIWYVALRDHLRRGASFRRAAAITSRIAGELFGPGSLEQKAVREAWSGVGVEADLAPRLPATGAVGVGAQSPSQV